ncbi:MAG TPA: thiamine pyrophosphate-dependent enzyme [Terriglobales bacterium]|jgi:thiamine pyrophosphate-dependent acetolactate synthase large subunit-like protein|nr:thiamine pyrophosphate-dependent enzyme [Terriglobales bacterium]
MKRKEALAAVRDLFGETPCFVTVGLAWLDWNTARPSDGNFHLKTLGSGSSVGLGMAMALPHRKIAVLDGDGAVIMNVNGLITVGRVRPKNLIHIVFDNKIYESSGCIPTASAYNLNIANFGRAAGIPSVREVSKLDDFKMAVKNAFETDGPHFIVASVEPSGEDANTSYSRLNEVEGKFKFIRHLEKLEKRPLREDAVDVKLSIR